MIVKTILFSVSNLQFMQTEQQQRQISMHVNQKHILQALESILVLSTQLDINGSIFRYIKWNREIAKEKSDRVSRCIEWEAWDAGDFGHAKLKEKFLQYKKSQTSVNEKQHTHTQVMCLLVLVLAVKVTSDHKKGI